MFDRSNRVIESMYRYIVNNTRLGTFEGDIISKKVLVILVLLSFSHIRFLVSVFIIFSILLHMMNIGIVTK